MIDSNSLSPILLPPSCSSLSLPGVGTLGSPYLVKGCGEVPGDTPNLGDLDVAVLAGPLGAEQPSASQNPEQGHRHHLKTALLAATLVGATLAGATLPAVTSLMAPTVTQSVTVTATATTPEAATDSPTTATNQDPSGALWMASVLAQASSQQLPGLNISEHVWQAELEPLQANARDLASHTDALLRNSKDHVAEHQQAIQQLLTAMNGQLGALQARLTHEGVSIHEVLGQHRDNLDQVGNLALRFEQQAGTAQLHTSPFGAEGRTLRALSHDLDQASVNLADATEKVAEVRLQQQALETEVQTAQKLMAGIASQQASLRGGISMAQLTRLDDMARSLQQGFDQMHQSTIAQQSALTQASVRAHAASQALGQASHLIGPSTTANLPAG